MSWASNRASQRADYGGNGKVRRTETRIVGREGNFPEFVEVHKSAWAGTSEDSWVRRETSTSPSEEMVFALLSLLFCLWLFEHCCMWVAVISALHLQTTAKPFRYINLRVLSRQLLCSSIWFFFVSILTLLLLLLFTRSCFIFYSLKRSVSVLFSLVLYMICTHCSDLVQGLPNKSPGFVHNPWPSTGSLLYLRHYLTLGRHTHTKLGV